MATLNAWALPAPFARDVPQRMDAIADHLASLDADIIAFQEVWTRDARRRLVRGGHEGGFEFAWHNLATYGGSGLLTLSRHPIESARFERFRLRGHPEQIENGEYLSGKGFALIRVNTLEGPLTVVNTHLHARYTERSQHSYRAHRVAQLVQLADALARTSDPVVTVGDFNFDERHPEHRVMTGLTLMRDAGLEAGLRLPTVSRENYYRRKRTRPNKRIDLIFVRDGAERLLRTRAVDRIFDAPLAIRGRRGGAYSNHLGVMAEIELASSAAVSKLAPEPLAFEEASALLAEGRKQAQQRRSEVRTASIAGLGFAALASASVRGMRVDRRRFLRNSLRGAALLAVGPGLGLSVLSEVVVPNEIDAFDDAARRLASLGGAPEILPS